MRPRGKIEKDRRADRRGQGSAQKERTTGEGGSSASFLSDRARIEENSHPRGFVTRVGSLAPVLTPILCKLGCRDPFSPPRSGISLSLDFRNWVSVRLAFDETETGRSGYLLRKSVSTFMLGHSKNHSEPCYMIHLAS